MSFIKKIFKRGAQESKKTGELSAFQLLWKTWNGKISITMIVIMVLIALFAVAYYTPSGFKDYERRSTLFVYLYPEAVPPCWSVKQAPSLNIFMEEMKSTTMVSYNMSIVSNDTLSPQQKKSIQRFINVARNAGFDFVIVNNTYTTSFSYSTENGVLPTDSAMTVIYFIGKNAAVGNNVTLIYLNIYLERPDGIRIHFFKGKISPSPGTNEIKMIGDYEDNITFLNKFYERFYKPFSINSLKGTDVGASPLAQYFTREIQNVSLEIAGGNETLANKLLEKLGYGVALYAVPGEEGKFRVLPGEYKLHFEVVYVVPKSLVTKEGTMEFDFQKAKQNDAAVYPTALAYQIRGNCYGMFGTDTKARPIGLGLLFGLPYAFLLGFIVTFTSTFIGAFYGSAAGYWKDIRGEIMMRIVDVVNSLPFLPILIALSVAIGTINLWLLAVLMIVLFWSGPVIVVRSMALQISEQIYVEAAKAIGAGTGRILFKHVFPQVFPYTMAIAVLSMPGIIIAEASLAVLGLGDPTAPTWGKLLQAAYENNAVQNGFWWFYMFPGLALVIFSAAFLILGRALEPIVAPKLIK